MTEPAVETTMEGSVQSSAPNTPWRRLEPRTAAASGVVALGAGAAGGAPTLVGIGIGDASFPMAAVLVVAGVVLLVGAVVVAELVRLARTRFRVGPERVELCAGVVVRARRSLRCERIRSVEITADPVLRVLGLAALRIGTGTAASASEKPLELRALRRADAEALRRTVLDPSAANRRTSNQAADRSDSTADDTLLTSWDPSWLRYAPLSTLTVLLGVVVPGGLWRAADAVGLGDDATTRTVDAAHTMGLVGSLEVGAAVIVVVGVAATVALRAESWWHLRLAREPTGTVHVSRGLLTSRSASLEERRLRGVVLVEPLLPRLVGAAGLEAVATGLSSGGASGRRHDADRSDPKELVPTAPRGLVERVAAAVLGESVVPSATVSWRAHPPAARERRVGWATASALVPTVALAVLGVVLAPGFFALAAVALVLAVVVGRWWGRAGYAALAHGVTGPWVVVRSGMAVRRTVVLRRAGVIGWSMAQTPFQRRRGLVTLWLTTAAGDGRYAIRDVSEPAALTLAEEVLGVTASGACVPVS